MSGKCSVTEPQPNPFVFQFGVTLPFPHGRHCQVLIFIMAQNTTAIILLQKALFTPFYYHY